MILLYATYLLFNAKSAIVFVHFHVAKFISVHPKIDAIYTDLLEVIVFHSFIQIIVKVCSQISILILSTLLSL